MLLAPIHFFDAGIAKHSRVSKNKKTPLVLDAEVEFTA
jgi:hypothetical protein